MKRMIDFFYLIEGFKLKKKKNIQRLIKRLILKEKFNLGNVNYIFCGDSYLLGLNREFLDRDELTDVISFDYSDSTGISGDIFISIERVKENAGIYKQRIICELYRVMIHGLLHLCGFEDKSSAQRRLMRQKEDNYLKSWKTGC